MSRVTRRFFLLSSTAACVACAARQTGTGAKVPRVRAPAVGQSWHYARTDAYTHGLIDDQIDRVSVTDHSVEIRSFSEAAKAPPSTQGWGAKYLGKYLPPKQERPSGELPSEIQDPWGMIRVDPHWGQVQVYETPLPLWPEDLEPGWHDHVITRYKTPQSNDELRWDLTMKAHAWESVTVPAGTFRAIKYTNLINFSSTDATRTDSIRQETLWLAPEVGRWVARESTGSFFQDDSIADEPYQETGYRWELLKWT